MSAIRRRVPRMNLRDLVVVSVVGQIANPVGRAPAWDV
jgi:hypothetical protein